MVQSSRIKEGYPKVPSAGRFKSAVFTIFPLTAACGRLLQLCGGEDPRADYSANFTLIGGDKSGKTAARACGKAQKNGFFGGFSDAPIFRSKNTEKCFTNRVEQSNKIADNAPVKIVF